MIFLLADECSTQKFYTFLIYITYKRKQEEITKKCEMAVRQRCRFAVPSGHTPLFASTSLCSFGRALRAHSPVRLNFALLVWLTKKCEVQP